MSTSPQLSAAVRGRSPSATLAINELSADLVRRGRRIYKLGLGQSPFPVAPPVIAALRANAEEKDYLPVRGLPKLREAVAAYFKRRIGVDRPGSHVLVGPGSKELLFITQLALESELLVPAPSWVSYVPQAEILGRPVRWLDTRFEDEWKLQPETLDRACTEGGPRTRLLILNYPNNPTGGNYSPSLLQAIAEVARRHGVIVVADEIYGDLDHKGSYVSIAPFYPEGTIIASGLSKWCGAGGWRVGVMSFPPELGALLDAMSAVASETFTAVNAPAQYAAITAFNGSHEIETYLDRSRRICAALGGFFKNTLERHGCRLPPLEGAFYLLPDATPIAKSLQARGITTSDILATRLLEETGVALLPGTAFGRPARELTVRLSYVDFDGGNALDAIAALPEGTTPDGAFLRTHCPRVVTAAELMGAWLSGN